MNLLAAAGALDGILKTIVGIGGLVFVHELGHFLVGRWCGVHAEAFSIGFGPVLLRWRGKPKDPARPDRVTEYRLSAIPLGGYVKFLGENPDERGERDPASFHAATYPRKVAILLAGVTMNVIAAFVLFALTYAIGWRTIPPVAGEVRAGYPAWENGIRTGDEIVSIDGRRVLDFGDIQQECAVADEVEVVIRRDGKVLPPMTIETRDAGEGIRMIGLGYPVHPDGRLGVAPGGAAEEAGFRAEDRVVAVDGKPVAGFEEAAKAHEAAARDTVWTVERDGARVNVTLPWKTEPAGKIGVEMRPLSDRIVVQRGSPAAKAGLATGDQVVSVGGVETSDAWRFERRVADVSVAGTAVVRRGERLVEARLPEDPAVRRAFAEGIDVQPGKPDAPVYVFLTREGGAARAAGLPDGVLLLRADDRAVEKPEDLLEAVAKADAERRAVTLRWRDPATREEGSTSVTPVRLPDFGQMGALVLTREFREEDPVAAVALAADRTVRWVERIFRTLGSVVTGGISASKLSGPIMIARMSYESAKNSLGDLFVFLGMISMNLAVLNVLPLPLLDGGQLAVHTIEKVRGRPIPEKVLEGVQWAGLVLLLGLMVYVIRNDILFLMRT